MAEKKKTENPTAAQAPEVMETQEAIRAQEETQETQEETQNPAAAQAPEIMEPQETIRTQEETPETQDEPETPEAETGFTASGLRTLGAGVWVYRHQCGKPKIVPDAFWTPAKQNYGMKDGDCVIFISGKQAALVVV